MSGRRCWELLGGQRSNLTQRPYMLLLHKVHIWLHKYIYQCFVEMFVLFQNHQVLANIDQSLMYKAPKLKICIVTFLLITNLGPLRKYSKGKEHKFYGVFLIHPLFAQYSQCASTTSRPVAVFHCQGFLFCPFSSISMFCAEDRKVISSALSLKHITGDIKSRTQMHTERLLANEQRSRLKS